VGIAVTDPRRCSECKEWKPLADFYQKGHTFTGRPRYDCFCKPCRTKRTYEYQHRPENIAQYTEYKRQHYHRRGKFATRDRSYKKFNATVTAYDLQWQAQHQRCAICLRPPAEGEMRFAFDHDHATGLARGVLCPACNGALGSLRDRRDLLLAAIRYLEYWHAQHSLASGTHGV